MRWRMGRQSQNIEDRRGSGGGFGGGLGGGMGMPRVPMGGGRRAGGIGGLGLIVIVVLALIFGFDPSQLLQGNLGGSTYQPGDDSMIQSGSDDELRQFSAAVLASTEDVWSGIFQQSGRDYPEPTLVLFNGGAQSACGFAEAAVGPFYCPGDSKLYIDLDFLQQLTRQLKAPGDFAQAYVIAHEVGHHVQNVIGVMKEAQAMRSQMSEVEWNSVSVQIELQADCFAGVWANHVNSDTQMIEAGDIEEAISAASAVGDDAIQQQTQGYVRPESFTHGSSQQRMQWFSKGFQSGEPKACDTFN